MGLLISHTPSFDNVSNVTALIVHLGIVAHPALVEFAWSVAHIGDSGHHFIGPRAGGEHLCLARRPTSRSRQKSQWHGT